MDFAGAHGLANGPCSLPLIPVTKTAGPPLVSTVGSRSKNGMKHLRGSMLAQEEHVAGYVSSATSLVDPGPAFIM